MVIPRAQEEINIEAENKMKRDRTTVLIVKNFTGLK